MRNEQTLEKLFSISEGIGARAMMGDHVVYFSGKVIGGVYDGRFMVKITPSSKIILDGAERAEPYDGAKPMLVVPDDFLRDEKKANRLFEALATDLPPLKRKKSRPE